MRRFLFTFSDQAARFASVRVLAPSKSAAQELIEEHLKVRADYLATGPGRVIATYFGNAAGDEAKIESAMIRERVPA